MHVFEVSSDDLDEVPLDAQLRVLDTGSPVSWIPLDSDVPFYPDRVLDLVRGDVHKPR